MYDVWWCCRMLHVTEWIWSYLIVQSVADATLTIISQAKLFHRFLQILSSHNAAQARQILVCLLNRPLSEPLALHARLLGVPRLLIRPRDHDGVLVKLRVLLLSWRADRRVQSLHRLHSAVNFNLDLDLIEVKTISK